MFSPRITTLCLTLSVAIPFTNAASQVSVYPASSSDIVNLRIEGDTTTYFEGPIKSGPRNITIKATELGQGPMPRPCNGLNGGANPQACNTPTAALDAAAKLKGFTYDGDTDEDIGDYYITRISTSDENTTNYTKFWGTLVNYQVSTHPEGITLSGCQQKVNAGDEVLWAFITYSPCCDTDPACCDKPFVFLKLVPTAVTVKKGKGFVVTVTDGMSGAAVQNASVDGVHTDANGKATLYLFNPGFFQFKAHQTGSVRSNVMNVTVTD